MKYVCIPNIKIPTKLLINPKYFAPLKPKEDLNKTTKGNPNFWDGLPIKFEKSIFEAIGKYPERPKQLQNIESLTQHNELFENDVDEVKNFIMNNT